MAIRSLIATHKWLTVALSRSLVKMCCPRADCSREACRGEAATQEVWHEDYWHRQKREPALLVVRRGRVFPGSMHQRNHRVGRTPQHDQADASLRPLRPVQRPSQQDAVRLSSKHQRLGPVALTDRTSVVSEDQDLSGVDGHPDVSCLGVIGDTDRVHARGDALQHRQIRSP